MAIGLIAGLVLGIAAAVTKSPLLVAISQWLRPVGTLFQNLLSMVVIPRVVTAPFLGGAGPGGVGRGGRGALLVPPPPATPDQQAVRRQGAAADSGAVRHAAEQITSGARFIVDLIPANPVRAAVDGNLLPLIVFVTVFAVAAAALPDEKRHALTELAEVAAQALIRIVRWVLLLAPLGIFAIVASSVALFGVRLIVLMAMFIATVIVGLTLLIAAVSLPAVLLVARLGARR